MLTIGIDIGTSYSSVAIINEMGLAEPVKISNGACAFGDSFSMPSAVFVEEDGKLLIGQAAMTSRMKEPSRFKSEFKRDLGQLVPYVLGSLQMLPEDCYKEMIIHFISCAEKAAGKKVSKAYLTCPANYGKKKREIILAAAKRAGLLEVEIIDEPTAAAYYYYSKGNVKAGDKLLVYDFGGGTFDVSLIQYTKDGFKPLAEPLGIERCGGTDIDLIIFGDIYSVIPEEIITIYKKNPVNLKRFHARILEMSIKAKHHLSTTENYEDIIDVGIDSIPYSLSRTKLNGMMEPLIEETLNMVRAIVKNAGLKMNDIDKALLVGGTSRIPFVQNKIKHLTGKELFENTDRELSVCMGAAIWKNCIDIKEGSYNADTINNQKNTGANSYNSKNQVNNKVKNDEQTADATRKTREKNLLLVHRGIEQIETGVQRIVMDKIEYQEKNIDKWVRSITIEKKPSVLKPKESCESIVSELTEKLSKILKNDLTIWHDETLVPYIYNELSKIKRNLKISDQNIKLGFDDNGVLIPILNEPLYAKNIAMHYGVGYMLSSSLLLSIAPIISLAPTIFTSKDLIIANIRMEFMKSVKEQFAKEKYKMAKDITDRVHSFLNEATKSFESVL